MKNAQPKYTDAQRQAFDFLTDHRCRLALQILEDKNACTQAIADEIVRRGNGVLRMPVATMYNNMLRLEALQLVVVNQIDSTRPGRARRIYTITQFGRACLTTYLTATADSLPSS